MSIEVKVPVLPESVSDATIATWHKKAGDSGAPRREPARPGDRQGRAGSALAGGRRCSELKFKQGDTVTSQQVMAIIEEGAVAAAPAPAAAAPKPAAPAAAPAAAAPSAAPARAATAAALPPGAAAHAARNDVNPADVEGTGRGGRVTKEDVVNYVKVRRRRAPGTARADDAHPPAHRRTHDAGEELDRHADLVQRGQPDQGDGDAQGAGRGLREVARHQARLHELLRQGRRQRAAEVPGGERLGGRQRRDLPRLRRHLDRGRHRKGPGDAGAAQRREHELRRRRRRHRRLRQGGARGRPQARGPAGRHLHHHQRRHLRLADVHADRQPAAERRSWACTPSRSARSPTTARS